MEARKKTRTIYVRNVPVGGGQSGCRTVDDKDGHGRCKVHGQTD